MYKRTTTVMTYHEFEDLVKKQYSIKDYDVIRLECWSNDTEQYFDPTGELDDCEEESLKKFIDGTWGGMYLARDFMEALVRDKVLEPGDYTIDVCW